MAKAGFFYTGISDCVRCFVCHIKLDHWDPDNDNPWIKHQECSSSCIFARLSKEEGMLTVEEWCDVIRCRTINTLNHEFNKLQDQIRSTNNQA